MTCESGINETKESKKSLTYAKKKLLDRKFSELFFAVQFVFYLTFGSFTFGSFINPWILLLLPSRFPCRDFIGA